MKFAYADPPYLGCSVKLYGDHPEAAVYDSVEGHKALIDRLCSEFSDGWGLSMTSGNLHDILPLCPKEARVMAWVKPFAAFKPNVGVAYAWEPVIVMGGRKRTRQQDTVRDWCSVNITLKRGFTGAKPAEFTFWLMDVLNVQEGDEMHDLFPGSGAVQSAVDAYFGAMGGQVQDGLFAEVSA
jgi:site-specific DNA-adenine methylase